MIEISKTKTWRTDLTAYVAQSARKSFRPGEHDCALFVAGAVLSMTGTDLAQDYRAAYRTLAGGAALLSSLGYESHVDLVANYFQEVPVSMAQEGDIAAIPENGELVLGIVQGPMVYVLRPSGLGLVVLTDAEKVFRV